MKTANLLTLLWVVALSSLILHSCSKSSDTNPAPKKVTSGGGVSNANVAGYWFGSFDGGIHQSFLFHGDGSLKVYDFYYQPASKDTTIAYDGTGTFTVKGDTITTHTAFPNGQTFTSVGIISISSSVSTIDFGSTDIYTKQ